MSYDGHIKTEVRKLRSRGMTFSEIMRALHVDLPKSTLSNWCADVAMPKWYQEKVDQLNKKSLSKAQQRSLISNRIKQEALLKEFAVSNAPLAKKLEDSDILKMLLAFLHLGEGAKWKSHRGLMLGSSDPVIVLLYLKLLRICYNIPLHRFRCRVSYRADQDLNMLQRYWSRITCIPIRNFYKTKPDPRTIGKKTTRQDYKGVCVVMCGGTRVQRELEFIPEVVLKGL